LRKPRFSNYCHTPSDLQELFCTDTFRSYDYSYSVDRTRYTHRGRGRGRGRGRDRGRKERWHKSDEHEKSKGRVKKVGKDQCMFCHKKGYYMKDCFQFKKAQDKLLKKNDDNDSGEERARVVLYQENDVIDLCHYSQHTTEYVYVTHPQNRWVVDSGATKHFSSYL
jgi:hypothetical protein